MSIQRYDILHPKMRDKGRFVLYADHIADKQSALDAQQAAHAAEVERLTMERDVWIQNFETLNAKVERLESDNEFLRRQYNPVYDALGLEQQRAESAEKERDAAVRERDEAVEALRELVEVATLRGDNDLPHPADDPKTWTARMQDAWDDAEAVLAKIEGVKS